MSQSNHARSSKGNQHQQHNKLHLVLSPVSIYPQEETSVELAFIDGHVTPLQKDLNTVVKPPFTSAVTSASSSTSPTASLQDRAECVSTIQCLLYMGLQDQESNYDSELLTADDVLGAAIDLAESATLHTKELEKLIWKRQEHHDNCARIFSHMLASPSHQPIALDQDTIEKWTNFGLEIRTTQMSHLEMALAMAAVNNALEKQQMLLQTALAAKMACLNRLRYWALLVNYVSAEAKSIRSRVQPDLSKPLPQALQWLENAVEDPIHQRWYPSSLAGLG